MISLKKKICYSVLLCILVVFVILLICNTVVVSNAKGKIYDSVNDIPVTEVGLLLGTTPQTRTGKYSMFFEYRIDATVTLYKAGKVKNIVISGDDNSLDGVNEPLAMRDSLVARGVPASVILLDGKGYRTLDSVVRLQKVYGVSSCTIISQRFHNERALYIAQNWGNLRYTSVIAYNAKDPTTALSIVTYIREYFARVKMFIDIISSPQH